MRSRTRSARARSASRAFPEPGRAEAGLFEQLRQPIAVEEHHHDGKLVLLVRVPSRLPGTAWQHQGAFWMRSGDALVPMSDERLRRIHAEAGPDFSAEICPRATLADLDPAAIEVLRRLWQRRAPEQDIAARPAARLLADAELLAGGGLTNAALILLGTHAALGRCPGQAEVVFEYRSNEIPGPAADRREFRRGFLPVLDEIWQAVNLRNDKQHFQHGLYVWEIPTFSERAVREAVLNAVSHRDYRDAGSVFVRQYPRRIAEVLGKCGLVERAGQGFDLIYRECIRQSKRLPDFTHTDDYSVWVTLHGEIQDPAFLRFLEEIGQERAAAFTTEDLLVIDLIHREEAIPAFLAPRLKVLRDQSVLERVGRGRGTRHLLSQRFYRFLGQGGAYTRRRGLDRETNKALLARHIEGSAASGATFSELQQVLPALSRNQIQNLLRELRDQHRIRVQGTRRWARWFPSASGGQTGEAESARGSKPEAQSFL
ncbi:MAG: transcriptional regulator [Planctomycetes bacterium]|nr:transcriptional regulator [Planctomycetota bacterium]